MAWRLVNADRRTVLRFATCNLIASIVGWSAGRLIDEVHPTWVAISVLVVMRPDGQKSYQRVFQRVFGSLIGAGVSLGVAPLINDPRLLIGVIVGLFFFVRYGVRRNYWLHCALMALVIFLGMKLASSAGFTREAVWERIADIIAGCTIAIGGTLFAFRSGARPAVESPPARPQVTTTSQ